MSVPDPTIEIFYADPVDGQGNKLASARLWLTHSSVSARVTKIPYDEIGISPKDFDDLQPRG